MKGIEVKVNPNNGYTVVYCHYSADPNKDEAWVEREKKLFPNLNSWKRMYEIDFAGLEGRPIYSTFSKQVHVLQLSHNPLKPIYRSWDFGVEACVCKFYQVDEWDRVLLLAECVRRRIETFKVFVSEAVDLSNKHFEPTEDKHGKIIPIVFEDFGDFAGTYSSDGKGQIYVEVLADFKIAVATTPFGKTTKDRAIEMMNRRFSERVVVDEKGTKTPKFLVDESCKVSIDAYASGYVYDKKERPLGPNHPYEDVADPDHYFLVNKFSLIEKREEPEEEYPETNPITGYPIG